MRTYGPTRATTTLLAAAVAGFLIWSASQFDNGTLGGYWAIMGVIAGAGLLMALSQLLGGWTKFGWPRLSLPVLLFAFVPVAIASLWVVLAGEPGTGWFHNHVLSWSGDIHIRGLVNDLLKYIPVLAFGTGLVFGYSFDTTGIARREVAETPARPADRAVDHPVDRRAADEPLTADRNTVGATRAEDRDGDVVASGRRSDGDRRVEIREGGTPVAPQPAVRDDEDV
jgi:hypothetical protein